MEKFTQVLKDFWNDEEGLTLLEYILGAALIVSALFSLGFWTTLATEFEQITNKIAEKTP
ncbi:Flp family type IVb pilin [Vibrio sp. PNB22_2_2]